MGEKKDRIISYTEKLLRLFPKNYKPEVALITDDNFKLPDGLKFNNEISYSEIIPELNLPPKFCPKIIFTKAGKTDLLVVKNRLHFYDGISMQTIGDLIYMLKFAGVKKLISIDEAGHLDPRLSEGSFCFVYDHINLMGDNPLIGPNDNQLGVRFPDMSDCYNNKLLSKSQKFVNDNKLRYTEAIYVGLTGPSGETEAEARFYREVGGGVAGYSIVPENITAVHVGIKFLGIGLLSRHLLADKMAEDNRSEKEMENDRKSSLNKANKEVNEILIKLIETI